MEASHTEQFHHEVPYDVPYDVPHDVPVQTFTAEETKEAFDVARNGIELLSTVLSSSPPQDTSEVMHLFHNVPSSLSHTQYQYVCFKLFNM